MGQSNLHFTIDDRLRLVLRMNPVLKYRGTLLQLPPVDPFPDKVNDRQYRKKDNENFKR